MNQLLQLKFVFNFKSLVSMKSMGSPIPSDLHFWLHYLCVISYMSTPGTKHNAFHPINRKLIKFYWIAKKSCLVSIFRMPRNGGFFLLFLSLLVLEHKNVWKEEQQVEPWLTWQKPQLKISSSKVLSLPWALPFITSGDEFLPTGIAISWEKHRLKNGNNSESNIKQEREKRELALVHQTRG